MLLLTKRAGAITLSNSSLCLAFDGDAGIKNIRAMPCGQAQDTFALKQDEQLTFGAVGAGHSTCLTDGGSEQPGPHSPTRLLSTAKCTITKPIDHDSKVFLHRSLLLLFP